MLKLNISRTLVLKGIGLPFVYLQKQGFKRSKAYNLANGQNRKVDLYDLEHLCLKLNCTPNDLLEWSPSSSEDDIIGHALQGLRRKEKAVNLVKLVQGLPVEQMDEIERMILEKMGKATSLNQ